MDVQTFLRIYNAMAPLRTITNVRSNIDNGALGALFLRPTANTSARESIYREVCFMLDSSINTAHIDALILQHRKGMWARVSELNRTKRRFGYSNEPLSPVTLTNMWNIVEAMQLEGASVHDCSAMVGIPAESLLNRQQAWYNSRQPSILTSATSMLHTEEKTEEVRPAVSTSAISTSDVVTPVASPQPSPQVMQRSPLKINTLFAESTPLHLPTKRPSSTSDEKTPKKRMHEERK